MKKNIIYFDTEQIDFINRYCEFGFKSKSSLVRAAINQFIQSAKKEELEQSARLYAELYKNDREIKDWMKAALGD